jgi:hypothetical protein
VIVNSFLCICKIIFGICVIINVYCLYLYRYCTIFYIIVVHLRQRKCVIMQQNCNTFHYHNPIITIRRFHHET